jgi:acyl-CoA synthetase (AMP-forming)/AMP-acid ligase II
MKDKTFSTLVELLRRRAIEMGNDDVYSFLTDGVEDTVSLSYSELVVRARSIGAALQEYADPGERALLLCPPGLDFVAGLFGALFGGAVAIPLQAPHPAVAHRALPRLQAVVCDAEARFGITTSQLLPAVRRLCESDPVLRNIRWIVTDEVDSRLVGQWRDPGTAANTPALLMYTSGSTALPKGVMLSNANLLHNLDRICRWFGHTPESRGVIWLPPYHDMGLIGGILEPVYAGFPVTLMSPLSFLQRPARWLSAISRLRATTSGGPNFAYDLCVQKITPEQRESIDLSSWSVAFNGAESVRADTIERFVKTFAPHGFRREAVYPCYGLAEATLLASGGTYGRAPVVRSFDTEALGKNKVVPVTAAVEPARPIVSCGPIESEQTLVIVDSDSKRPCPTGIVGEIWLSGQNVALGYWNRPEETSQTFDARLYGFTDQAFLRTGDLGFVLDGELFITGRLKDMIVINGSNHYPEDLERTAQQSHPRLTSRRCVAMTVDPQVEEQLVIAVELDREIEVARGRSEPGSRAPTQVHPLQAELVASIRRAIAEYHGLRVHSVLFLDTGRIPKTTSGKIQRAACRQQLIEGMLAKPHARAVN